MTEPTHYARPAGNVWEEAFAGIAYGVRNAIAWLRRLPHG